MINPRYLPVGNDWTLEEKVILVGWKGKNVYVDLGDSILTGGEFVGLLEHVTTNGVVIDGEEIPFENVGHIELRL